MKDEPYWIKSNISKWYLTKLYQSSKIKLDFPIYNNHRQITTNNETLKWDQKDSILINIDKNINNTFNLFKNSIKTTENKENKLFIGTKCTNNDDSQLYQSIFDFEKGDCKIDPSFEYLIGIQPITGKFKLNCVDTPKYLKM